MAPSAEAFGLDIVTMAADCTIRGIETAHLALRSHVARGRLVRVDCRSVEQADVTFVQLMVSAQRSFAARDVGLVIDRPADCVSAAFQRANVALPAAAAA